MLGAFKREVHQTIVDEPNLQIAGQEPALVIAKLARIGDHRIEARLQKHPPGEHEFWIEILLLGLVIDDGNPRDGIAAALAPPFIPEHVANISLEIIGLGCVERRFYLAAASELSPSKERVEEGTARIRVDLRSAWGHRRRDGSRSP
jgi:hypothetical protein